jgi:hypothetical protein
MDDKRSRRKRLQKANRKMARRLKRWVQTLAFHDTWLAREEQREVDSLVDHLRRSGELS